MNLNEDDQALLERLLREQQADPSFILPVNFDLTSCMTIVGLIQLAMRHPEAPPNVVNLGRHTVEQIETQLKNGGFAAHVEAIQRGWTRPVAPAPCDCQFFGKAQAPPDGHPRQFGREPKYPPAFPLVDTGGNQCALVTLFHSPCYMTTQLHLAPSWAACPRNPESGVIRQ